MKTKKTTLVSNKRKLRKAVSEDKEDLIRSSNYEDNNYLLSLQANYYGSMDRYVQQKIHDCY
jgi:hypothetical protein